MDKPHVNLIGPANQLGYGVATLNILEALSATHKVAFFPIGGAHHDDVPDDKKPAIDLGLAHAGVYQGTAPSVRVYHQNALAEHVGRGKRVGFPFFELRQLDLAERHHLGSLEQVVVASEWARGVVEENGVQAPVAVAPLGVDRRVFHEGVAADRLTPDHTVFVNAGKWEVRKGHDVLLRAFCRAFNRGDKVILKMLPANPFIGPGNEQWTRSYMGSPLGEKIAIERRRLRTQAEVAAFMATADCAVFPARAEAWNLELLEAMSLGLYCIATDYAGHTQYATQDNCRLIEVTETETARDGVWFHGDGEWGRLGPEQEEQLVEHMRAVHRAKQLGELPARNEAGIATAKRYTWQRTAELVGEAAR